MVVGDVMMYNSLIIIILIISIQNIYHLWLTQLRILKEQQKSNISQANLALVVISWIVNLKQRDSKELNPEAGVILKEISY